MSGESPNFRELFARSLVKIAELKSQLESQDGALLSAPIAVVGMSCRFPGGGVDPESFWRALEREVDGVIRIPESRWRVDPTEDVPAATRWAGLLDSIDGFDATFFNISPREALRLDPQQRMLLELSWEALERAGLPSHRLMGSRTGVFLGMSSFDYGVMVTQSLPLDVYSVLGGLLSTAAGRISYTYGLQGPCLTLDTACSSSLTAVHLACQSLRTGESDLALAGGVNLILLPHNIQTTAALQAMSPEGRCKTFDAEANGFALGEGCGVVVLKRAAEAIRDRDPILAIIRSSVANHDGRTSGLTVPNVLSQQSLLRRALDQAQLAPEDIGYVELHGTGTPLGDPIEFEALRAVLGKPRSSGSPCVLGAVKTNVGHLASAAGVAGLIKAILCLEHQAIPKNLHFRTLNPRIELEGTPFVIPTERRAWPSEGKPRRAGVSSFGVSGTNVHVILEEHLGTTSPSVDASSSYLIPLSARSARALQEQVRLLREWLIRTEDWTLRDVAYTLSLRRSQLEHRLCLVAETKEELVSSLASVERADSDSEVASGVVKAQTPRVVFVFAGQGTQWVGMTQQLFREESTFRQVLTECDAAIRQEAGFSILEELDRPESESRLWETEVVQPVLFATQVALVSLLGTYGVVPSLVIGHSFGEAVAAYVAGLLDLDQAVRLVVERGRAAAKAKGAGKMVSVPISERDVQPYLSGHEDRVGIAAINDANSVVLSGDTGSIDQVIQSLHADGVQTRPLRVDFASHCPQLEQHIPDFVRALGRMDAKQSQVTMVSTVTGKPIRSEELDAAYWGQNLRQTVRFSDAMTETLRSGPHLFIEVGPHPVLALPMEQLIQQGKGPSSVLSVMRRGKDARRTLLQALGALHAQGCTVNWEALHPQGGTVLPLPTYPWQRERYWVDAHALLSSQKRTQPQPAASLLHAVAWQALETLSPQRTEPSARLLILCDTKGHGVALANLLHQNGQRCTLVSAGEEYRRVSASQYQLNPTRAEDFRVLMSALAADAPSYAAVIHLFALDAAPATSTSVDSLDRDLVHSVVSAGLLADALASAPFHRKPSLFLVTSGAQAVGEDVTSISVAQSALWGMGRSLHLQYPDLQPTLIDLSQSVSAQDLATLVQEVLADRRGQHQVALRSSGRYGAQILQEPAPPASLHPLRFRSDASYLITGGLGGLGLALADWLIEQGAQTLVLAARSEPSERASQAIAKLQARGAHILVLRVDVSDAAAVANMMQTVAATLPPLRGIIHTAGVPPTAIETTSESLLDVTAPKVRGGWNLHEATRNLELDFFVLYSSASALLGVLGGAGYAVGNAFLDALAHHRRALGLPATSVQWGVFGDAGMHVNVKGVTGSFGALDPIFPREVHPLLAQLLAAERTAVGVMRLSVQRHIQLFPHLQQSFFWSALLSSQRQLEPSELPKSAAPHSTASPDLRAREQLLATSLEGRPSALFSYLRKVLARITHTEPSQIPKDASLHALGMDSLMCLELRNKVDAELGVHLPIKDILASGSVDALLSLFTRKVFPETESDSRSESTPPGQWVVIVSPRPQAQLRLICFPYAGGNASVFRGWSELLPPEIELCAIQPPGRQERSHEPLLQTVEEMVAEIVPALLPYLDRPFATFGHCIGAMVMYEVVRALEQGHQRVPEHVFASGALPPRYYLLPPVATRTEGTDFVNVLRRIGFADDLILGDEESARELLPAVQSDFDLAIRYECASPSPLPCPITSFCGREDQLGPPERTAAWKDMSTSRFEQVVFPGEHYFIIPERQALLQIISQELVHHVAVSAQRRTPSSWIRKLTHREKPSLRLFCFHGAWESPQVFAGLSSLLSDSVEVCVIERPGYGDSAADRPLHRIDDMVRFLTPLLAAYQGVPFAFLGHNIGSILMFELTRSLRRAGMQLPVQLFVAATDAPHLYWSGPIHIISTEKLLEGIEVVGLSVEPNLPESLLRADSALLASYTYAPEPLLTIPIAAVIGKDDHFVPRGALRGWRDATTGPFSLHEIDADHNLLRTCTAFLAKLVEDSCLRRATREDIHSPQNES